MDEEYQTTDIDEATYIESQGTMHRKIVETDTPGRMSFVFTGKAKEISEGYHDSECYPFARIRRDLLNRVKNAQQRTWRKYEREDNADSQSGNRPGGGPQG